MQASRLDHEEADLPAELLEATGRWRARDVSYWAGRWDRIQKLVPAFSIEPFRVTPDGPPNPHINAVVRRPLAVTEYPIPVGTVSNSYQLAQHHDVVGLCLQGLQRAGVDPAKLRCEVGLTPLAEWMNFRVYFPDSYGYTPRDGKDLGLRLECFNSVDGSSRLLVLLSWFRLVCSNGLVIRETKASLRDVHDEYLHLDKIPGIVVEGMKAVDADLRRMKRWESRQVASATLEAWVNEEVSAKWGKKAACRVFHICRAGHDVEIADPFAKGESSQKPVTPTMDVPGAARPAKTLYDVGQALSWVASNRSNTEERVEWQSDIPELLGALNATT
jgi:hypothetical protein